MKKSHAKRGFTLIEIMVSLSIFLIVMTISMGAILGVFTANRKSQSLKAAMDNLNAAIETMSREARFGSQYHCGGGDVTTPQSCNSPGSNQMAFWSQDGHRIIYSLDTTNHTLLKQVDSGSAIPVTSNEVNITNLAFYVFNTDQTDQAQPKIFMKLKGLAGGTDVRYQTGFDIQTLISQRSIDIGSSSGGGVAACSGSGLLGCWLFDENGGNTANNSSGSAPAGTLRGSASWTPGQSGSAVLLLGGAGSGDDVAMSGASGISGSVTVSARIKFNSVQEATVSASYNNLGAVIFSTRANDGDVSPTLLITPVDGGSGNSGLSAAFVCDSSGLAVGAKATVGLSPGDPDWHRIVGVFTSTGSGTFGGNWDIYIDGTKYNPVSNNFNLAGTCPGNFTGSTWFVGNNPQWQGESGISVDELKVFNRALSAAEVAAL